jgi:hypothetical protein
MCPGGGAITHTDTPHKPQHALLMGGFPRGDGDDDGSHHPLGSLAECGDEACGTHRLRNPAARARFQRMVSSTVSRVYDHTHHLNYVSIGAGKTQCVPSLSLPLCLPHRVSLTVPPTVSPSPSALSHRSAYLPPHRTVVGLARHIASEPLPMCPRALTLDVREDQGCWAWTCTCWRS